MTVTYMRRLHKETISDIVYWRWDDRPLGNIAVLKSISRQMPRHRLCMLRIFDKPRVRVSSGWRKETRVMIRS